MPNQTTNLPSTYRADHDEEKVGSRGVYATYRATEDGGAPTYVSVGGRWVVAKDGADSATAWTLYRASKKGMTAQGGFRTSDLALLWARAKDEKNQDVLLSYGTGKRFGVAPRA